MAGKCFGFGRGEYGRLGLNDTKSRLRPHEIGTTLEQEVIHQSACGGTSIYHIGVHQNSLIYIFG